MNQAGMVTTSLVARSGSSGISLRFRAGLQNLTWRGERAACNGNLHQAPLRQEISNAANQWSADECAID